MPGSRMLFGMPDCSVHREKRFANALLPGSFIDVGHVNDEKAPIHDQTQSCDPISCQECS